MIVWLISVLGAVLNAGKRISGFYCWMISNSFFTLHNFINGNFAYGFLFTVYTLITFVGIINWRFNEFHHENDFEKEVEQV